MDKPPPKVDSIPPSARVADSASRYELLVKIASGGMATVHVGRLKSAVGVWRLVAIKRAHPHLVEDATFRRMLIEEARLAARIHHPNVVAVQDVEEFQGELRLVMDYIEGISLAGLLSRGAAAENPLPARLGVRIALDACLGLHAAHELTDERGAKLHIVHRDVSPHNILVGADGVTRLTDFGIAKCARSGVKTSTGSLKGKAGYMAPEYIETGIADARADVFALAVVMWETLARKRLFKGSNELETINQIISRKAPLVSEAAPWVGTQLDAVMSLALERAPEDRFASAGALAAALETAARKDDLIASHAEVGAYVRAVIGEMLDSRRADIQARIAPDPEPAPPEAPFELVSQKTPPVSAPVSAVSREDASTLGGSSSMQEPVAEGPSSIPLHKVRWAPIAAILAVVGGGVVAFSMLRPTGSSPASGSLGSAAASARPSIVETTAPPPPVSAPVASVAASVSAAPRLSPRSSAPQGAPVKR